MDIQIQDELVTQIIDDFTAVTGDTPNQLVGKILYSCAHFEMVELLDFINQYSPGSEKHNEAITLLKDFDGGSYIFDEMKRIDPDYQTPEESMLSMEDTVLDGLATSLDEALKH